MTDDSPGPAAKPGGAGAAPNEEAAEPGSASREATGGAGEALPGCSEDGRKSSAVGGDPVDLDAAHDRAS